MVKGLDTFKRYFEKYEEQYVLIGGAACNIVFESIAVLPETVKADIDSFIESLENDPFDANLLKQYGLSNQEVIDTLRRVFK